MCSVGRRTARHTRCARAFISLNEETRCSGRVRSTVKPVVGWRKFSAPRDEHRRPRKLSRDFRSRDGDANRLSAGSADPPITDCTARTVVRKLKTNADERSLGESSEETTLDGPARLELSVRRIQCARNSETREHSRV